MLEKVSSLGTNTSEFKSLINQFTSDLQSQFLTVQPTKPTKEEKRFWASAQPRLDQYVDEVEELIDEEFRPLRRKLSGYSLAEYYPRFSDDFSNDKHSMRNHMRNCSKSVGVWSAELWQDWAIQRLEQLLNEIQSSETHQWFLQQALTERQDELERINYEIECAKHFRYQFVEKMEADEDSSRKFVALLERAYLDELHERHDRLIQAPTAAHAFIELLAADQLINERKKLINTLS
jgi:hypothetical protein